MATTAMQCKAANKQGEPCQSPARESGYCWAHDPAVAADRAAARSAGGLARHGRTVKQGRAIRHIIENDSAQQTITIEGPRDVLRLINQAIADALSMEVSLNRARTLGSLAETAIRVFQAVELEARLTALESMIGGKNDGY